jgi:hypothetical protein
MKVLRAVTDETGFGGFTDKRISIVVSSDAA